MFPMGRPPAQPQYEPNKFYPARNATSLEQLLPYLRNVEKLLRSALADAESGTDETTRIGSLLSTLGRTRDELETSTRLVAEYAMRDQALTQREAAARLGVSHGTTYVWRLDPVSIPRPDELE